MDTGGEAYVEMRRRLCDYFDRRGLRAAEDLADETLNRVARRIEEEGVLPDGPPGRYCYIVAKFVLLEALRRERREGAADFTATWVDQNRAVEPATSEAEEVRLSCLERCLGALRPVDRDLIVEYYTGGPERRADRRRALAARFSLTANALAIRACRIRDRLEQCVRSCVDVRG